MKKRQSTVEPVIGTLVNYQGMKKVHTKGLQQANKCMTLSAAAYNIKKLMNYKSSLVKSKIQEMRVRLRSALNCLLPLLNPQESLWKLI